jgi:hypothetical protein
MNRAWPDAYERIPMRFCVVAALASALALAPHSAAAQSAAGMVPFTLDHRKAMERRSPVDVSFLLDAPAGRHGFLRIANGHLATGDGQRIRLWGVNITDWSRGSRQIPAKQDAPLWAATLARFGVNCVRFQFLDLEAPRGLIAAGRPDTRSLDPDQLDREDFFIAELEKRGIYIDFNLLVGRPFKAGDGVADASLLREGAKGTSIFDGRMIELQKEYARELLGHRNPYTGLAYVHDPAVALVEINNENALNIGYRPPSPFYEKELTGLYNQWLAAHRTPQQIAALRRMAGVAGDAPVPLMFWRGQAASAPPERFYAEAQFYNDTQRDYFARMKDYLQRTLGSQSLVIATADHSHSGSGYPILMATSGMDVIDGHTYWEHPGEYSRKSPMVDEPFRSTVEELSRSAIAGKPYTVSEVNEPFPNDYAGEGIPILAAYGAMQDWDAILWYTFEPKADPAWKPYVGDPFDISLDPVKMPELAAGALLFLRADVAPAKQIVNRTYTAQQVYDSMLLPETERPYFTPGFPLQLPLQHEMRILSFDGPPTQVFAQSAAPDPIRSDNGELAWHRSGPDGGMVTVDSPRTQALIGFLRGRTAADRNLAAQVENRFCALQLSSLDGKPISRSAKLLLVAGGRVENTGQRWNSAGTDVTNWGEPPTLIEPVRGALLLKRLEPARAVTLQAIDGAGQPSGPAIAAARYADGWKIPLGQTITTWYQLTITR